MGESKGTFMGIIDTNILIEMPTVLEYVLKYNTQVVLNGELEEELKNLKGRYKDSDVIASANVETALSYYKKHKNRIMVLNSDSCLFGDAGILQSIIILLTEYPDLKHINVYTNDKDLTHDCYLLNNIKSINHTTDIVVFHYNVNEKKFYKASVDFTITDNHETKTVKQENKVKQIVLPVTDVISWHDGVKDDNISKSTNSVFEKCYVPTISGQSKVLKYWLDLATVNDVFRLYAGVKVYAGDIIYVNVFNDFNIYNVTAGINVYRTSDGKSSASNYVLLKTKKWETLKFVVDDTYDFVNIDLCINAVCAESTYTGIWGYIDDFKIVRAIK